MRRAAEWEQLRLQMAGVSPVKGRGRWRGNSSRCSSLCMALRGRLRSKESTSVESVWSH